LIILPLWIVTGAAGGAVIDEFEAFTGDFGAVASSSLATVETEANVEVRSRDNAAIALGTGFFWVGFLGDFF
jgi:hypothetical protein